LANTAVARLEPNRETLERSIALLDRNLVTVERKLAVVWLYGIAKLWFTIAQLALVWHGFEDNAATLEHWVLGLPPTTRRIHKVSTGLSADFEPVSAHF